MLNVLNTIATRDANAIRIIESYVDEKYPGEVQYISAKPAERKITFAPNVFSVPDASQESDLVAVMMPFRREFDAVFEAIKQACAANGLRCLRADDIWEESLMMFPAARLR